MEEGEQFNPENEFDKLREKYDEMWAKADKVQITNTIKTLGGEIDKLTENLINLALHAKVEGVRLRATQYIFDKIIFTHADEKTISEELAKFFNKNQDQDQDAQTE